ncbi:hypothetical protein [Paenibacillus amylolyticus]|uniref:hypothetical protein n=1 Tax=Paenibacillus amylolyticus TaxID=1451 RepID=UPI000B873D3F|nr:hypothetical protein [Paenibacillus amylolyticus]
MKILEEKFTKHNIPYNDIDKEMVEIIDLLNFKANLKTKYCCIGHREIDRLYVMFDDDVNSDSIKQFADNILSEIPNSHHLVFNYWIRVVGRYHNSKVKRNWMMESKRVNQNKRKELVKEINEVLNLRY